VVPLPSILDPLTQTGLAMDTAAVRAAVLSELDQGHDVVTISHSYGGIPMTNSLSALSKEARARSGKKTSVLRMGMATSWLLEAGSSLADTAMGLTRPGDPVGFVMRVCYIPIAL